MGAVPSLLLSFIPLLLARHSTPTNVNARVNSQMIKSLFTLDKKVYDGIYHNESLWPPSSSIVSREFLVDVGRNDDGKMP